MFNRFAYAKKPPVYEVVQSDSETSSAQCFGNDDDLEFEIVSINRRKKRRISITSDSEDGVGEEVSQQKNKRKRLCIVDSEDDDSNDDVRSELEITGSRQREEEDVIEIPSSPLLDDDQQEKIVPIDADHSLNVLKKTSENETRILSFLNTCSFDQLCCISGCSKSRAEKIKKMIPFQTTEQMLITIESIKGFSADSFFDGCLDYLNEIESFEALMEQCEELSKTIEHELLLHNKDADKLPVQQPACINSGLELKNYQIVGLNWLAMLHERNLNGILADQMGLGKTIQALSFLGHLLENGHSGPHVIVCPCSTLDNWVREFKKWLPDVSFIQYNGNQNDRFHMRKDLLEGVEESDIIVTTFNIALSTKQDRGFFRKLKIQYLILDEAHMIKNIKSGRFKHLLSLQASRKLLLTGTPLQNDLVELLSLLTFLMPDMFEGNQERIKFLFCKPNMSSNDINGYEEKLLPKVKKMLKPFVLRRLKKDVLRDIPAKLEHICLVELTPRQNALYVAECSRSEVADASVNNGMSLLMKLRKVTNHPLLLRDKYNDSQIMAMAKEYCKSPFHSDCLVDYVYTDMSVMSDFELHMLCKKESILRRYQLSKEEICDCGKLKWFDEILPKLYKKGDRVLIFSQFVIVLDILVEYMKIRNYTFLRIDGSTKGSERQTLIDEYNENEKIFIFLLSTKAGGLGINLTSANTVIFHDIDFNPYNDKQAEDRCHRVGQNREVTVYKCISKNTVEETILKCGEKKLLLEKEIVGNHGESSSSENLDTSKDVIKLLMNTLSVI